MDEHIGKVADWNDARGFGFIEPREGGARVFFHIYDFQQRGQRPRVGDGVKYQLGSQANGRPQAMHVRRAGAPGTSSSRRAGKGPRRSLRLTALLPWWLVAAYAAFLAWAVEAGRLPVEAAAAIAAMCVVTFIFYAHDKRAAVRGGPRVSEGTLHLLELLGGWPAAIAAQQALRHKSSKRSYRLAFWCFVAFHILGMALWAALSQVP